MRDVELWGSAADLHYPHLPSSLRTWVCTGKQQDQLVREEGEEQSQTAEVAARSQTCREVRAEGLSHSMFLPTLRKSLPHAPVLCLGHAQYITSELVTPVLVNPPNFLVGSQFLVAAPKPVEY
ncbi:unnamed protein product [Arctogadus glacialis]